MKRKSWSDEVSQSHLSLSKRGQLGTGVNCSYYSLCCLKTFGTQSTFINQNPKLNETKQRCSVKPENQRRQQSATCQQRSELFASTQSRHSFCEERYGLLAGASITYNAKL